MSSGQLWSVSESGGHKVLVSMSGAVQSFGSSSDFNWDFRSLSEPNSRRSKGLDPFETRFNLSRGENHEEDSSRRLVFGEEDGDDEEGGLVPRMIKKSLAGLQIKQSERDQTGKWQPDPVMASSSSFSGGMDCGDDDKVSNFFDVMQLHPP